MSNRKKVSQTIKWRAKNKSGGRCAICGSTNNITMDHFIPLSLGGKNELENIIPLCENCNRYKGDMLIKVKRNFNFLSESNKSSIGQIMAEYSTSNFRQDSVFYYDVIRTNTIMLSNLVLRRARKCDKPNILAACENTSLTACKLNILLSNKAIYCIIDGKQQMFNTEAPLEVIIYFEPTELLIENKNNKQLHLVYATSIISLINFEQDISTNFEIQLASIVKKNISFKAKILGMKTVVLGIKLYISDIEQYNIKIEALAKLFGNDSICKIGDEKLFSEVTHFYLYNISDEVNNLTEDKYYNQVIKDMETLEQNQIQMLNYPFDKYLYIYGGHMM